MCCHGSLDIDTPIRNRVASYLYSILPWAVYTAWCQHKATQRKLKESNFTTFKHASMMIWVNLIYQSIIDFQGDCTHQVELLTGSFDLMSVCLASSPTSASSQASSLCSGTWALATPLSSWLLISVWPSSSCCGHLGSETAADGHKLPRSCLNMNVGSIVRYLL